MIAAELAVGGHVKNDTNLIVILDKTLDQYFEDTLNFVNQFGIVKEQYDENNQLLLVHYQVFVSFYKYLSSEGTVFQGNVCISKF